MTTKLIPFIRVLSALIILGALGACASDGLDKEVAEKPVEALYNQAFDLMTKRDYAEAAKAFSEVERQHPYSTWANRAMIMEAFAQYQNLDYESAQATLSQFIETHPGSAQIAYAYYLRALCSYEQIKDVRRDQGATADALQNLRDIILRFSDTPYARDAKLKIALVQDHLAGGEMEVGRYYLNQKLYIAALKRFQNVTEKYQTTSHVPEAIERMVESYIALGIPSEARRSAAVLGYNFPGSEWYAKAYAQLLSLGWINDTAEIQDAPSPEKTGQ